ncbi:MAG: FMN-binding domain protein [Actinomycetia bacterium]|nr:FMN-binding domain protein [Actinomycetes bacterium]
MNRAVPAVIATVIGLGALATFKSSPSLPAKSTSASHIKRGAVAGAAPPVRTTTSALPRTGGTHAVTGTTPTTRASAVRTIDGDPFDNQYGTVQVRVTLHGTQITDVTPLQMPVDRARSADISQQAAPLLLQEVLQAQSAQIDIVGGASYTSQSYAQSLQSALDKASH